LAGDLAARFCLEHGIPAVYRRQTGPDAAHRPDGPVTDPVAIRRLRMT
jgi:hypothetical protein